MMPQTLMGVPVMVIPEWPRFKLPDDLPLKPEFRAAYDSWLLEFFGLQPCLCKDGQYIQDAAGTIYMNERTYQQLRNL